MVDRTELTDSAKKSPADMDYGEFLKEFSVEPKGYRPPANRIYYNNNETVFADVVDTLRDEVGEEPVHFMGIAGGGDVSFNYMAALQPERSFLFDASPTQLAYVAMRSMLIRKSDGIADYHKELLCKETDEGSVNLFDQGFEMLEELGLDRDDPAIARVFIDASIRERSLFHMCKYIDMLKRPEVERSWFYPGNFEDRSSAVENMRAFVCDFYDSFGGIAQKLVEEFNIQNIVLYTSNISEVSKRPVSDFKKVLLSLDEAVERVWVVDSRFEKNRICARGGKAMR